MTGQESRGRFLSCFPMCVEQLDCSGGWSLLGEFQTRLGLWETNVDEWAGSWSRDGDSQEGRLLGQQVVGDAGELGLRRESLQEGARASGALLTAGLRVWEGGGQNLPWGRGSSPSFGGSGRRQHPCHAVRIDGGDTQGKVIGTRSLKALSF